MGRAISSLLIAAIVACPLVCGLGHVSAQVGGTAATHRCGCCQDEAPAPGHSDSCPAKRSPAGSGHSCQCICGGAVMDDAGAHVVNFDWSWSLPATLADSLVGQICDTHFQQALPAYWPDVGLNTGRSICCLFNTYLC